MLGGGGSVFIVVVPTKALPDYGDTSRIYLRIPRDEVRSAGMFWENGDMQIQIGTTLEKPLCIRRFMPPVNTYREAHRQLSNDTGHRVAALAVLEQIFEDLTVHEVDIDVTWTWSYERVIWERLLGRPGTQKPTSI